MRQAAKIFSLILGVLIISGYAFAEYGLNFPAPATDIGQEIYDVHMFTMIVSTILLLIIFTIIIYSLFKFRKSKGYEADQNFHKSWFGTWSWVMVPAMVLGVDFYIAGEAQGVLDKFWNAPKQNCAREGANKDHCFDMNVKTIGHQWWWEYEFPEQGVNFNGKFYPIKVESRALDKDQTSEELYLRDVDNQLVLPVDTTIRFLNTSVDVLHAWWVPELGFKRDSIPGYIMETWATIEKEGTYRGQCAELCGTWHAKMPIVVKAVSKADFEQWIEGEKAKLLAKLQEANSNKDWTKDELMTKGEQVYNTMCAGCHQVSGLGLGAAFPALKNSPVAMGPAAEHINMVLNGKNTMPAWKQLSDIDLAAVITYERNAWGNSASVVKPADIKAAR